jgi:hypothetical protein
MERPALYIRLIIATIAAVGSAVFVAFYAPLSMTIVRSRMPDSLGKPFPDGTQALANCGWYPLLIPILLLASGISVIHLWKNKAAFDLVIGCQWLFALLWLEYCLLMCLLPEIPLIE